MVCRYFALLALHGLLALATAGCAGASVRSGGGGPMSSRPVRAAAPEKSEPAVTTRKSVIKVEYREAASAFEILDNAASWLPEKNGTEYKDDLVKRIGLGEPPRDADVLEAYRKVRSRYYAEERSQGEEERERAQSVFGHGKPADRVAEAFYAASSVDDALARLGSFMKPADVLAVRTFFTAFLPKIQPLLAEGARRFGPLSSRLEARLSTPRAVAYVERLAAFYGVGEVPPFQVLYVWWPPIDESSASARGKYLLLRYNPETQQEEAGRADDIVVHELAHWLSMHQPLAQRQLLTAHFTKGCDVTGRVAPLFVLEEPLAVAQQKVYLSETDPERLEFSSSWYGDPWVGTFAKLLYPQVKEAHEKGRHLDETLMRRSSRVCAQLEAAARSLGPPQRTKP